ncbi:hypothetical protein HMPREF1573_01107 [Gardnerella vaginalis JCP7276]|nr:hypothetical protein HMPREF1573_01107 [Gardnerella vaginalis JCP7276]
MRRLKDNFTHKKAFCKPRIEFILNFDRTVRTIMNFLNLC